MKKFALKICFGAMLHLLACSDLKRLPKPELNEIEPDTEVNSKTIEITMKGSGFYLQPIRNLSDDSQFETGASFLVILTGENDSGEKQQIELENVLHINDTTLQATIPKNSPSATYTVHITTPEGQTCDKTGFTLHEDLSNTDTDTNTDNPQSSDEYRPDSEVYPETSYVCRNSSHCSETCTASECAFECSENATCLYHCSTDDCTLNCNDDSTCNLKTCEARKCGLTCNTSNLCQAKCQSSECVAQNMGTGLMDVVCSSGCNVTCKNGSRCIVDCVDQTNCDIDCGDPPPKPCGGSIYACNTSCP